MSAEQVPIGLLLARVRRRQRQFTEAHLKHLDLSVQQFWVLVALHERTGLCLADLVTTLPMDQPTASRVVASLGDRGLVAQVSDSSDRRRRRLALTRKGSSLGPRLSSIAAQVRGRVVSCLSGREVEILRSFLNRILENLDQANNAVDMTAAPSRRPARSRKAGRST